MQCTWHPDKEAVNICVECGKVFCEECRVIVDAHAYCSHCKTKPKKKTRVAPVASGTARGQGPSPTAWIFAGILVALGIGYACYTSLLPSLPRVTSLRNQTAAQEAVQTIARGIEQFIALNGGALPQDESQLTQGSHPYLRQPYNEKTVAGYRYYISLHPKGYEILAAPVECHKTGEKVVMLKRGQALALADCE